MKICNAPVKPSPAGPLNTWFVDRFQSLNLYGISAAVNGEAIFSYCYKYSDVGLQDRWILRVLNSESGLEGGHLLRGLPTAAAQSQAMWRRAWSAFPANHRDTLLALGEGVVNCVTGVTSHPAPSAWASEVWGNLRWLNRVPVTEFCCSSDF